MNKLISLILTVVCCNGLFAQQDFLSQQKRYSHVRTAITQKKAVIAKSLNKHGLAANDLNILMVACKAEGSLEIYAKKKSDTLYRLIADYPVCASSGDLGPKRRQGDGQVPEGFYRIDRFNPASNFHLSLGIDYPNLSDRRKSSAANLGGDIFIHGSCVTVGCLPMTDDKIKEIYLYAVYARNCGQRDIPVYIFPFRMTEKNFRTYIKQYSHNKELTKFWTNLKVGYNRFVKEKKALRISVDEQGNYNF